MVCWMSRQQGCICAKLESVEPLAKNVELLVFMHNKELFNAGDDAKVLFACCKGISKVRSKSVVFARLIACCLRAALLHRRVLGVCACSRGIIKKVRSSGGGGGGGGGGGSIFCAAAAGLRARVVALLLQCAVCALALFLF